VLLAPIDAEMVVIRAAIFLLHQPDISSSAVLWIVLSTQ
jgi:hypothetical protein